MDISINKKDTENKNKIKLFVDSFGDSEETAKEFFLCDDIITVTEYVGNRLAAMASLVPIYAQNGNCCQLEQMSSTVRKVCGYYIYGVCVDKDYRGMGLFPLIMKKTEEEAINKNADFVCLIPADTQLEATYRKWGYNVEIQNSDDPDHLGKRIFIDSPSFRDFALPTGTVEHGKKMCGLMKVFNKEVFAPADREFAFGDFMGDI